MLKNKTEKNIIFITKSDGSIEPFSLRKVVGSARHAGASKQLAEKVALQIRDEVKTGQTTAQIFDRVRELLKKESLKTSIKFSLKEAMKKMGPSGFHFEKYVAEVLRHFGYEVKINQHISGKYISGYEIDILAQKDSFVFVGECKYHWLANDKIDLKVALYSYARYLDIMEGKLFKSKKYAAMQVRPMIITNAQFTNLVFKYAAGKDIALLGWGYPKNGGLEDLIEKEKLYPITILPSMQKMFEQEFARAGIMMARDLIEIPLGKLQQKVRIPSLALEKIAQEAKALLENGTH